MKLHKTRLQERATPTRTIHARRAAAKFYQANFKTTQIKLSRKRVVQISFNLSIRLIHFAHHH